MKERHALYVKTVYASCSTEIAEHQVAFKLLRYVRMYMCYILICLLSRRFCFCFFTIRKLPFCYTLTISYSVTCLSLIHQLADASYAICHINKLIRIYLFHVTTHAHPHTHLNSLPHTIKFAWMCAQINKHPCIRTYTYTLS